MLAIAGGPFVLPVLGLRMADLLFVIPLILLPYGTSMAIGAARRRPERRLAWWAYAAACGTATAASLLGLIEALGGGNERLAFYGGFVSSAFLVVGGALLARDARRTVGPLGLVDPILVAGVAVAAVVYVVVIPCLVGGDPVLTAVVIVDLVAFLLAAIGASSPAPTPVKAWLIGALAVVAMADGLIAADAAGLVYVSSGVVPVLWAVAGWCFAVAAGRERVPQPREDDLPAEPSRRSTYAKVLLPLSAIVAYPVITGGAALAGGSWVGPVLFFGPLFVISTVFAFARQAILLVEHRSAAAREGRLHAEAVRRNAELEALTGLASTMTEVLEERPVVARGLEALRVAAGTSSSALHLVRADGGLYLAATTGRWATDKEWAPAPRAIETETFLQRRGRRHIARVPLCVRGRPLGVVTLVRPERLGSFEGELDLLRLLIDQLAVALQNARDYREKLEAAIRDPLTGLYNRRFFYEAFAKEVAVHERYGVDAALVLFDIDDFKSINDSFGHAAGDEVLQEVARIVGQLVRPSDTFARVGGEEFAVLMPQTGQLDALLVAERVRTGVARHPILEGRPVTLSGGVAAMPQDGTTREEVERRADQALYWAKRNGKNMCAVASDALAADSESGSDGMLSHLHAVVTMLDADGTHLLTRDHSENVASHAVAVSQLLGLDGDRIVKVRRAAFLHDIGDVAVPDAILAKPGPLTDDELEVVRLHPCVGANMLSHAGLADESTWVRAHHERVDGGGYPDGLAGDAIPLEARIVGVADSFEAMTSDRPYRRGLPVAEAIAELRRCAGTQFDPVVVDALATLVESDHMSGLALREPAEPA